MCLLLATATVGAAQAQDWVVNTSDGGFDPMPAAGIVRYNITVTNNDTDPAPATTLTLTVPATGILTGIIGSATGCSPVPPVTGPATILCNLPALGPDAVVTIVVTLESTQQGTITLGVSVPSAGDPEPGNNTDDETTTVTAGANFSLGITAAATAVAGSAETITLTALNNGPDTAVNKTVQFPVPTGFVPGTLPAGCSLSGSTIVCLIPGPVADNASVAFAIPGQITAASGSTVTFAVSVIGGSPPDAVPADNTATVNVSITPGSDVAIGKTRSPAGTLVVGNAVTFVLDANSTGDNPTGLVIRDQLPVNYAISTVTAPGWTCTITLQVVRCTRAAGPGAGQNISLGTVTINATVISSGATTNTATITATGPFDSNIANNTATDGGVTIQDAVVDLAASKTGPVPALVVQGSTYGFDIGLSNIGNFNFIGTARMTDSLPAGMTVTAYTANGWNCTPPVPVIGPATIVCTLIYTAGAPLTPGETAPSVGLTTLMTATGPISNSVLVGSPNPNVADLNTPNNTATYGVTSSPGPNGANVSVIKSRTLASVVAGQVQSFGIEIVNAGPQTATTVQVRDALTSLMNSNQGPTEAGFVSAIIAANVASGVVCGSTPASATSRQLNCDIASLPICTAGSTCPVITVLVRPGGNVGPRTNVVTAISQDVADPNLADNRATVPYDVAARADMTVSKLVTPSPAIAGQDVTYVITATNIANGLSDADGVVITDTLPSNLTFVSASPSVGSCATTPTANTVTGAGNNTVQCQLGTIVNGAQRTVTLIVRPTTVTRGTTVTNLVNVTTTTPETDTTNNDASTDVAVANPVIDLSVNKTESVDPVAVGDDTVYTVTVRNLGPSTAENVVVTDVLPPGRLRFQSFTIASGGSCSALPALNAIGGTMVCEFPVLQANETKIIIVTMRGDTKGITTNNVSVRADETALGFESTPSNDSTSEITTIRTRADVEVVSKVATPATVNLRDVFSYVVRVRNNTGPLLAEADDTVMSDTLPSGMVLAGTPTIAVVVAGPSPSASCSGVAGGTGFSCALGVLSSGGTVDITVPVKVIAVTSRPQVFRNTASVTTTSRDVNPANDSNFGDVTISSSSVAGTIFRDFNNNAALTSGADTGIAGINVTLSGLSQDGATINITVPTDGNGNFTFTFVPEGTYAVSHAAISEAHLIAGTNTPGTAGGTNTNETTISGLVVPPATNMTGNLFAKVPQARIALAKAVSSTTVNADGSFVVTFGIRISNPSLEALNTIAVTDVLNGAAPKFGNYVTLANPSTSPMIAGTYTVQTLSAGTCSGSMAGFDGSANTTLISGTTIAAGQVCNLSVAVRVQPVSPLPPILPSTGRYENQATVTGVGVLSGQTSATTPQLTDLSDNGTNPDTDGDGIGNETGENDLTPVAPNFTRSIALIKTASTAGFSQPVRVGDQISYSFTVTNTGNVTLANVGLTDSLPGIVLSGGPIAFLAPGAVDTTTFTATYAMTNADLLAMHVDNQATATGTWSTTGGGAAQTVSDLSGTTNANNTVTVVRLGGIALIKTADISAVTSPAQLGQTITYRFTVTNTGPVALTNVTVTDPLPGLVMSGAPIATLAAGASNSTNFTATYQITQADIDAGTRQNQAVASGAYGVDGSGNPILVTDSSGSSNANDMPTIVPLTRSARIDLIKRITGVADTNGNGRRDAGDTVSYAFGVTNTGNLGLGNVTVSDPRVILTGTPIALAVGASNIAAYNATYVLTQADVDRGYRENTAAVAANARTAGGTGTQITGAGGAPITAADVSDTGTNPDLSAVTSPATTETPNGAGATDADPTNDPTVAVIAPVAGIQLTKTLVGIADTNGNGFPDAGDTVSYRFAVKNLGNVALGGVAISDPLIVESGGPITLAVGATNSSAFTGNYVLTAADISRSYVDNSATVAGSAQTSGGVPILVGGAPLIASDVSDTDTAPAGAAVPNNETVETADGAGGTDGNATNDPTVATITPSPRLRLLKTAISVVDVNTNGQTDAGDRVTYRFAVTNTGNVALQGITVTDPLVSVTGGPVNLAIGASDTTTFTASYVLVQANLDRGYVENTATTTGNAVTATATPILGAGGVRLTASEVSDSGSTPALDAVSNPETTETPAGNGTTDGNATNDPTVVTLAPDARISLIKRTTGVADTNGNGFRNAGDTVSYAFDVTNTGNLALGGITVADPVVTVVGPVLTLAAKASQTAAFTASYVLTQADVDRGYAQNSATVSGAAQTTAGVPVTGAGGAPITAADVSDTGTNPDLSAVTSPATTETPNGAGATDADPTNDPTVAVIAPVAGIQLTKTLVGIADTNGNGFPDAGDTVSYRFAVKNLGNVALGGVAISDPLIVESGGPITLAVGATNSTAFTGSYVLTAADISRSYVDNSATVAGSAQTSGGVPILVGGAPLIASDLSDTDTAPAGAAVPNNETVETADGAGGTDGNATNDPTVAAITPFPSVTLVKRVVSLSDTNGDSLTDVGDTVTYGFTVINSGNVALANIVVTDPLVTVSGGPISLAIGASNSTNFSASYVLIQADLDRGYLENTALAVGDAVTAAGDPILDAGGVQLSDQGVSDTGTDPNINITLNPEGTETPAGNGASDGNPANDPTVLNLLPQAQIQLLKRITALTDTTGNGVIGAGDTVSYGFSVTNTGNVPLGGITVTDPLVTVVGAPINLAPRAVNSTGFTASYVLTQNDVDAGFIQNTATANGGAQTTAGVPITGPGGVQLTARDVSDTGTNPDVSPVTNPPGTETPDGLGGTDADPTNDPTTGLIVPDPRVVLVKSLVSLDDTNGNGFDDAGDTVRYSFSITNTGNVALGNVVVTDPLVAVTGNAIRLAVGAVNTSTFTAAYVLVAADVSRGYVENTASVTARAETSTGAAILGPDGDILATDVSDAGTTPAGASVADPGGTETANGAGSTDGNPTNDPTVAALTPEPRIQLTKSAVSVTDTNANGQTDAGDRVSYSFVVINTGNVALQGITVTDPQVAVAGGPVNLAIGAGDTTTFTASYALVQADLDRGYIDNSATTTGTAVTAAGTPILGTGGAALIASDVSDSGSTPALAAVANPEATETPAGNGATDGNPTNDPTAIALAPQVQIALIKRITGIADTNGSGRRDPGDTISYAFDVTNPGNVGLGAVTVTDALVTVAGGPISLAAKASQTAAFTASYVLTQADIDRGYVQNTANVSGAAQTTAGVPITGRGGVQLTAADVSDTGTNPDVSPVANPATTETPDGTGTSDADPGNDPTVGLITQTSGITLIKTVSLAGLSDPISSGQILSYTFTVQNTGAVTLNNVDITDPLPGVVISGGPIASLAPGAIDSTTFTATYPITAADIAATEVSNQGRVTGSYGPGNSLQATDLSGIAASNDTPTQAITGTPKIEFTINISGIGDTNGNGITDAGDVIFYSFTVTNIGDVTLAGANVDYGSLSLTIPGLTCAPVTLLPGQSAVLVCTNNGYTIQPSDTGGPIILSGSASGTSPIGSVVSDGSVAAAVTALQGGVTLTKQASTATVTFGGSLTWTIIASNPAAGLNVTTRVVDTLPPGFVYLAGSARVDGVAVTPQVDGQRLVFNDVFVAAGSDTTLTLETRVTQSARPGRNTNRALILNDISGEGLAPEATAVVKLAVEAVFDCATVIGRVFDDRNQDGYMNGLLDSENRDALTDQTYVPPGKYAAAPADAQGEPGLPNVRLISPNGVSVTTDEHGRFSLPCAALPRDIGSNFSLKLDPRSLPSGYRLTSENPRVVRLTPGMITKMTFGATLSRVVRVDLAANAFVTVDGKLQARPELEAGLRKAITQIARQPSMMRLTYQLGAGEDDAAAQKRLRIVERLLHRLWPANGAYQLNIETTLLRALSNE